MSPRYCTSPLWEWKNLGAYSLGQMIKWSLGRINKWSLGWMCHWGLGRMCHWNHNDWPQHTLATTIGGGHSLGMDVVTSLGPGHYVG
jgi:hypothetical protein